MSAKNPRIRAKHLCFPLLIIAPLLASCAGSEPTRFYTLSSLTEPSASATELGSATTTLGVGPISLPRYVDRPQIVSRDGPYRLRLAEFDSWGEPLEDLVPRVIADNLGTLLATNDVLVLPRRRQGRVDMQVEIEILRFDFEPTNAAVLIARWEIFQGNSDKALHVGTATINEALSGDSEADSIDYEAAVAALSKTLVELSNRIATAIQKDVAEKDWDFQPARSNFS